MPIQPDSGRLRALDSYARERRPDNYWRLKNFELEMEPEVKQRVFQRRADPITKMIMGLDNLKENMGRDQREIDRMQRTHPIPISLSDLLARAIGQ
jgi:hypothetical protein